MHKFSLLLSFIIAANLACSKMSAQQRVIDAVDSVAVVAATVFSDAGKLIGLTNEQGELPMATGCLVMNCSTVAFICQYVKTGVPLIKRRLTVDGNIVNKPMNLFVPIGTKLSDIMKTVDTEMEPERVIFGGPMMGSCVYDSDSPIMKTNNAVLFMAHSAEAQQSACIRCGRCVRACSMNLLPTELETAYDRRDVDELKRLKVNLCMNCGSCTFVCPAKRNLAEKNQLAKLFLRNSAAK